MMSESICVKAPATVANLGSGFDLMGLAIEQIADEVTVTRRNDSQLLIQSIEGDGGLLPTNALENTCTVAIQSLLDKLHCKDGFDVRLKKHIAFNSGLGSSASSAVAGVFAVNELLGKPMSREELILPALDGEYLASKGYHADNVAPCMFGGITYVQNLHPLSIVHLPFSHEHRLVVLYQYVTVSTSAARSILPLSYERSVLTKQSSRIASLMMGLVNADANYLAFGLGDEIATPFRKQLIPHFDKLEQLALQHAVIGFNISGSGPSVFAWCKDEAQAQNLKRDWQHLFTQHNERCEIYLSPINANGVELF
jgi:homoserine kinase